MSKLCFLIFYTLYARVGCNVANTGTVLFSSSDIYRQCWHPQEISILTSRMILQDLLPDVRILEISDNEYVEDVINYFRLLFDVVQKATQGRIKHIMLLALTDLIGGYLQHAVLPKARHAFYSGQIDFCSMEKLIQLYEELKWFLRTNGQGWARPMQINSEVNVEPIDLTSEGQKGNKSCCSNLIYYQRQPVKNPADTSKSLFFPTPFFDSKVRPSSIAVPFKRFALRNIESKRAAYLITKYYISVHNCLKDLKADKSTLEGFQDNFYTWIEKNVIPKLRDDKFYSAFGGILRVQATLKVEGAKIASNGATECYENEGDQEVGAVPGGESPSRSGVVLIGMLVTIFLWFIIGTVFICYRIKNNSKKPGEFKMASVSSASTTSYGSSSRWSSSKRTLDTCKCCTTPTEKTTEINSSMSSVFEKEEDPKAAKRVKKEKSTSRSFTILGKSSKQDQTYDRVCLCDGPPVIDPKHSMKVLPSIPEISENSSSKRDLKQNSKSKRITFDGASSKEDFPEPRKSTSSKLRICKPRTMDIDVNVCPYYDEKATSLSTFSTKTRSASEKELGTQMSETGVHETTQHPEFPVERDEKATSNENTTEDTTDTTNITANFPHIYACHSSLTGNYTKDQRFLTEKPFIFGYDFQTSSSSELSDEESDARTSTTK